MQDVEGGWGSLERDGDEVGGWGPGVGRRPGECSVDGLGGVRMGCVDGDIEGRGDQGEVLG